MKFTKRQESSGGGSDKFLKFKDGETQNVIFKGEIYEFHMKWINGKSVLIEATDPEAKVRFKLNAIVSENGAYKAKIWEFPLTIYNKLCDINSEYPLENTVIKITRQGTGTDTEYHLLPLLKVPVPKALDRIDLNILDAGAKKTPQAPPNGWDGEDPGANEPELPF